MSDLPQVGQPAPNFTAPNSQGKAISLGDFASQWLVLYFYPKDNTSGCTTEAQDFPQFLALFCTLVKKSKGLDPQGY